jgi:hypothetical protein
MDDTAYRTNPLLVREQRTASSSDTDDQKKQFAAAILPCLALVAPMSMNEEDRKLWLRAAYVALGHIPFDLLALGAKAAMASCTHPSKIVPTILEHVSEQAKWRTEKRDRPLRIAAPSNAKAGPLDRKTLDRMSAGGSDLLTALRDLGLAAGYLYRGEDGRIHEAFEQQDKAA